MTTTRASPVRVAPRLSVQRAADELERLAILAELRVLELTLAEAEGALRLRRKTIKAQMAALAARLDVLASTPTD